MAELASLDFKRQIDRDGVPSPAAGIDMDLVRDCIHCGLCLPKCPTFRTLHHEGDSPRGRMWQIKEAALGLVAFDDPGLERAIERVSKRLGVEVEHHEVLLRGTCTDCD